MQPLVRMVRYVELHFPGEPINKNGERDGVCDALDFNYLCRECICGL